MKSIVRLLAGALVFFVLSSPAQTNAPIPSAAETPAASPSLNKHIQPILGALKLDDAAKEARVREVLSAFFTAHSQWHQQNDPALKGLWNSFNQARSKPDADAASKALADIDGVYATFKPQHDQLISGLAAVLSPQQIETVEDVLTVKKTEVTYHAYLEIFPALTAAQKDVVLQDLKAAREQAVDAGSMTEKSAFYKKYKIKIEEDYLTAQGYDPKQARKDFAAKQKAEAARKGGSSDAAQ